MRTRPDLLAYALIALIVVAAVVLSIVGDPVPPWFELLVFALLAGALGVAVPAPVAQLLETATGTGAVADKIDAIAQDVTGLAGDLQGHLVDHTPHTAAVLAAQTAVAGP